MKKIVIITGASSGIGKETAKMFLNDGDIVVNLSKSVIKEDKYNIICDISNEENIINAVSKVKENFQKIDILINNAGYGISGATELIETAQAKNQFDTNFFGAFLMMKHCLPLMSKFSKIINISSACAIFPLPYRTLYCASKSALNMLSKCVRMELANAKIDVVSICPGDTKTNFTKNRVKIFLSNEKYGENIKTATMKLDKREDKRMNSTYVANKIFKIAKKTKTKPQYIIGFKYKIFLFFSKILPQNAFEFILKKLFLK